MDLYMGEVAAYLDYTILSFFRHNGVLDRWMGAEL